MSTNPKPTSTGNPSPDKVGPGDPGAVPVQVVPTEHPLPKSQREQFVAHPAFGQVFTDHMVTCSWSAEHGWSPLQVGPYKEVCLSPAAKVFHYGQAIFEGLKAYRQPDGQVALFRPQANAARFARSAARMAMPQLPQPMFLAAVQALVRQDRAWVPSQTEQSLYLRPFMVATEPGLGVQAPAQQYLFAVIASPAGAYFPRGVAPVKVWLSTEYSRAAAGGTGEAKCAGNYAGAFVAQQQAVQAGCDQVVWLDAAQHQYVEEMGGMNLFFVYGQGSDAQLVTPKLTGSLLPGITRQSLLELAPRLGLPVRENTISVTDWQQGCHDGQISEVFACGTAAVITPVGEVVSAAGGWLVGDGQPGPVTLRLRQTLLDLQFGTGPDPLGWRYLVC